MSSAGRDPIPAWLERSRLRRLRSQVLRELPIGGAVWMLVWIADWLTVFAFERAEPLPYLLIRPAAVVLLTPLAVYVHTRDDVSERMIVFIEHFAIAVITACLGLLAAFHDRGLASGHPMGVVLLLMFHGLMMPDRWTNLVTRAGLGLLVTPITLYAMRYVHPPLAAQWTDPESVSLFLSSYFVVVIGLVLTLAGGDIVFRLRQSVEELKSIGRYRLERRLAKGGMGEVWVAYHAGLQRDVAVKIMHGRQGADTVARERFEREVRTLAELTHPNTVRVFDYGVTEDGSCYYAMELLEGEDLARLGQARGAVSPRRAARYVLQAARALAEAHARGIVHRDIKPANLFLLETSSGEEVIKLIDFGIARSAGGAGLTRDGLVVGTPGYLAPEVIRGGAATPRADVYALGMVLRDLVAGGPLYGEITPERIALAQLTRPAEELASHAPTELRELLLGCFADEPEDRFADAAELAAALERMIPELSDEPRVAVGRESSAAALAETQAESAVISELPDPSQTQVG